MSLRLPVTLHSWQPIFKAPSFSLRFAKHKKGRNHAKLFDSCQRCRSSNSAQDPAQRRVKNTQRPRRETPKSSRTQTSGSLKPAAYEPLADKLARRASPTLLYRASSCGSYLFGCYAAGAGLFAAAWFNYRTLTYVKPGGVPSWVPTFTSVGSFMIACGGIWMLLKPQNVVRTISSLPSPAKPGLKSGSLLLQIERAPVLPFQRRKPIIVPQGDVTMSSPVFNDDAQEQYEAKIKEITWREERLRAFVKTNLLTLPFRQVEYWTWRGFVAIKSAFTRGGFHHLHVRGRNTAWKLDKDPSWALDDGKALDKLVKINLG